MKNNSISNNPKLPVDIVLSPAWWYHNEGITFDEDFFYNPAKRVESERKMEKALYERWGKYGLGEDKDKSLPVVGPVHLASGYLMPEMFGCKVKYKADAPPQQICAQRNDLNISAKAAFESSAYKRFALLCENLEKQYGYIIGDVGVAAILNCALDIRGESLFTDMYDKPGEVKGFLAEIAEAIERFVTGLYKKTGSTSISINRNVRHLKPSVFINSECSHTMTSVEDYEKFFFDYDVKWGRKFRPYGIHYCGKDPHRYAKVFSKLPAIDFLDVGWGGDVTILREHLPNTFLNIRLSPVEIVEHSVEEIDTIIRKLVSQSANPGLTGICCINMDEKVADEKINAIFETVTSLRKECFPNQVC